MGYDVTYHPITRDELNRLYFEPLINPEAIPALAAQTASPEFYKHIMKDMSEVSEDDYFNTSHGLGMAAIAGCLNRYWYIRGGVFSFLCDDAEHFEKYALDYGEIIPKRLHKMEWDNFLNQNYCSGAYIPHEKLPALLKDLTENKNLAPAVKFHFSHGRLKVFLKAIKFAIANNKDLLEATDLVVPYPFSGEGWQWRTYPEHCEKEGVLLYIEAAHKQMEQLEARAEREKAKAKEKAAKAKSKAARAKKKAPRAKKSAAKSQKSVSKTKKRPAKSKKSPPKRAKIKKSRSRR